MERVRSRLPFPSPMFLKLARCGSILTKGFPCFTTLVLVSCPASLAAVVCLILFGLGMLLRWPLWHSDKRLFHFEFYARSHFACGYGLIKRESQKKWFLWDLQVAYVEGSLWEALVQWPQPRKGKPKR